MGISEDFIDFYRSQEGVYDIIELSEQQFSEARRIESSISTQAGQEYENVGFEIVSRRSRRFCLYVEKGFRFEKKSHMVMMSGDVVTGMLLSPDEIPEYEGRTDVIWISKDFIMFPEIMGNGNDRFVLYPYEFPELSEMVPGCSNAVGTSPTMSADVFLKSLIGVGPDRNVFTFIIGFD